MKIFKIFSIQQFFALVFALIFSSVNMYANDRIDDNTRHCQIFSLEDSLRVNHVISGYINLLPGNDPFNDVIVTFSGIGDALTDDSGFYTMEVPEGWNGEATPHLCEGNFYTFYPSQISYVEVFADINDQNYDGEADTTFVISGKITDKNTGDPLANKQIIFSKSVGGTPWSIVVETNAAGEYSFEQLPCWDNVVNPAVEGYYYLEPFTREYTDLAADMPDQDYTFINFEYPVPPDWNYTQTGDAHIISIRNTAFPDICGTQLELGDLIGVFFYDFDNELKCGGFARWQDESNVALIAQGDDNLTPDVKDGFGNFELMNWKIYSYANELNYPAKPVYQTGGFLSTNNKFTSGGLSIVNSIDGYFTNIITLPEGWSGLSSYTKPNVQLIISNVMAPIMDELIIIQDLEKIYYPAGGINTMFVWTYNKGYKIKVSEQVDLPINGCPEANKTINLVPTWNILPVMSKCDVDPLELFSPVGDKLLIVKDIAGTGVYWPAMGVNSLEVLKPGRAYFVAVTQSTSVTFSGCEVAKNLTQPETENKNTEAPWQLPELSGSSHIVAFTDQALTNLNPGDFIGAFSQDDICFGLVQLNDVETSTAITVFGDDALSPEKDGFADYESILFKVFDSENQEEINTEVTYSGNFPSADGRFTDNGLSVVETLKFSSTGEDEPSQDVVFFPNPSSGIVHIESPDENIFELTIQNINGKEVFHQSISGNKALDFTAFNKGVYLVKITNPDHTFIRKLILN
ncbi:MAG: T9SS type A sorting domain-containing protein [Bacteroidales bacterium]|nr:T9SS type A sorting domain-containing protein [Bacteroidales bacterium]